MQTIYKFELKYAEDQIIELYQGFEILKVAEQGDTLCLWAIVDPKAAKCSVKIRIYGTGAILQEVDGEILIHLGTVLTSIGFVWHVFQFLETGELYA